MAVYTRLFLVQYLWIHFFVDFLVECYFNLFVDFFHRGFIKYSKEMQLRKLKYRGRMLPDLLLATANPAANPVIPLIFLVGDYRDVPSDWCKLQVRHYMLHRTTSE